VRDTNRQNAETKRLFMGSNSELRNNSCGGMY
jgi:hypothetical protein